MKHLILFFLLFSTVAWAQPRRMGDGPRMRGMGMMQDLKLTDDQRQQVDKFHSDLQKKQIALHAKIQALQVDVRDGFRDDKPDRAKVESKINDITKLQGEMKANHLAFWFDVNKILTPEQQKVWKEKPMMMMNREGGCGMRGPMHRMGMGMMGDDGPGEDD